MPKDEEVIPLEKQIKELLQVLKEAKNTADILHAFEKIDVPILEHMDNNHIKEQGIIQRIIHNYYKNDPKIIDYLLDQIHKTTDEKLKQNLILLLIKIEKNLLSELKKIYQNSSGNFKTTVAQAILEHCLFLESKEIIIENNNEIIEKAMEYLLDIETPDKHTIDRITKLISRQSNNAGKIKKVILRYRKQLIDIFDKNDYNNFKKVLYKIKAIIITLEFVHNYSNNLNFKLKHELLHLKESKRRASAIVLGLIYTTYNYESENWKHILPTNMKELEESASDDLKFCLSWIMEDNKPTFWRELKNKDYFESLENWQKDLAELYEIQLPFTKEIIHLEDKTWSKIRNDITSSVIGFNLLPDDLNLTITYTKVEPNGSFPIHKDKYHHILLFLSGTGDCFIDDETYKIQPPMQIKIPAGTKHGYKNTSSENELILLTLNIKKSNVF